MPRKKCNLQLIEKSTLKEKTKKSDASIEELTRIVASIYTSVRT
jgi:hypothetical protein